VKKYRGAVESAPFAPFWEQSGRQTREKEHEDEQGPAQEGEQKDQEKAPEQEECRGSGPVLEQEEKDEEQEECRGSGPVLEQELDMVSVEVQRGREWLTTIALRRGASAADLASLVSELLGVPLHEFSIVDLDRAVILFPSTVGVVINEDRRVDASPVLVGG